MVEEHNHFVNNQRVLFAEGVFLSDLVLCVSMQAGVP